MNGIKKLDVTKTKFYSLKGAYRSKTSSAIPLHYDLRTFNFFFFEISMIAMKITSKTHRNVNFELKSGRSGANLMKLLQE